MDPPRRQPSQTRLPITVIEKNVAPQLQTAQRVARKPTPVGMPAPPHVEEQDRQSYDDIEHVAEVERLERERAQLLAELQDAKQENRLLRETAPTVVFPPPSIPPPGEPRAPKIDSESPDIKAIEKAILKSRLGRTVIGIGVLVAIGWNAFNTVRSTIPLQKAEAVQARVAQNEQASTKDIEARTLERERAQQRDRAYYCFFKQLRGASARNGLDLPSLPPGGVRALKLADEDPNRPGPPRFVAEEKCPDLPPLPPEGVPR